MTPADIRRRLAASAADSRAIRPRGDNELNPELQLAVELRPAAVLVPLVDRDWGLSILLTRRTDNLAHHAGQIAFPGGGIEKEDADAVAAALRETEEEIGLDRRHVEPIGQLGRYVTRTGFTVTPIVAIVTPPFELKLDPIEVADSFEVPLDLILDPANRQLHSMEYEGMTRHFYAFPYGERTIWGATAGMLVDLAERLVG